MLGGKIKVNRERTEKHMKKRIVSIVLALSMVLVLVGCSNGGVSQADYDKVVAERDAAILEAEALEKERDGLIEASLGSTSLQMAQSELGDLLNDTTMVEYRVGRKDVLCITSVYSDTLGNTSEFGKKLGELLANGEIEYDYVYYDWVIGTGQKVMSLIASATGDMKQASFE